MNGVSKLIPVFGNYPLLLITMIFISMPARAIVNMDGLHFNKVNDSFSADLDLLISGSSGNTRSRLTSLNGQFSRAAKKSINLVILGYKNGESNNVTNINKAFAHYRYIHQLSGMMDLEFFAQIEQNEFTRLSYRGLTGLGARFSVFNTEIHHAFLGAGGFVSREKIEYKPGLTDDGVEELARANFYFMSKYKVNSEINFSNVLYYQPRINELSDYRALFESKLDFKINEDVSFRISLEVEHDSKPSQTIKSTDINYMTGLKLSF